MDYLIGIEIGVQEYKVSIYDTSNNLIAYGSEPVRIAYYLDADHPYWSFWVPEEVWDSIVGAMKKALVQIENPQNVRAVSVTGVGMDGLPVDREGTPLYPIISWQCNRSEKQWRKLQKALDKKGIYDITGSQLMPYHTICRLMWIKESFPEIYEKTYKWLMIEDFVNMKLCGEFVTDKSMACTTSMFDVTEQKWSKTILQNAGWDTAKLAEIKESGTIIGNISKTTSNETGLSQNTLVVLGGHDYMCAALAVHSYDPGRVLDILGAWEMIIASINAPRVSWNFYNAGFSVANQVALGLYAVVGETVSVSVLDWFRDMIMNRTALDIKNDNNIIWRNMWVSASKSLAISKGVFFLPHCFGAGAPFPDSRSSGAFIGLNETVEATDLLRSVVEGLNYQFRNMLEALAHAMNTDLSYIICVGEESKNDFLLQNKADVTGKFIEVPHLDSATMLGAAMLAGVGSGLYKDYKEAAGFVKKGTVFEPDKESTQRYNEGFELYKKIYSSIKEINWEIFDKFRLTPEI